MWLTQSTERRGEALDPLKKARIGDDARMRGIIALPIESNGISVASEHVAVKRVVADVGLAACKPLNLNLALALVEVGSACAGAIPLCLPVEAVRDAGPEISLCGRVDDKLIINASTSCIAHHHNQLTGAVMDLLYRAWYASIEGTCEPADTRSGGANTLPAMVRCCREESEREVRKTSVCMMQERRHIGHSMHRQQQPCCLSVLDVRERGWIT